MSAGYENDTILLMFLLISFVTSMKLLNLSVFLSPFGRFPMFLLGRNFFYLLLHFFIPHILIEGLLYAWYCASPKG